MVSATDFIKASGCALYMLVQVSCGIPYFFEGIIPGMARELTYYDIEKRPALPDMLQHKRGYFDILGSDSRQVGNGYIIGISAKRCSKKFSDFSDMIFCDMLF